MREYAISRFTDTDVMAKGEWRAFLMLRESVLWDYQALTSNEGGIEKPLSFRGPSPDDVSRLEFLRKMDLAGGPDRVLSVLADAELAMAGFPLWLDHHRTASDILGRLGVAYAPAKAAVIGSIAVLLARLPGLEQFHLEHGRPTADAETLRWITSEVKGGGGGQDTLDGAAEAEAMASENRLGEAIAALTERRDAARSERTRFRLGLLIAKLLIRSGRSQAALLLLEELDQESAGVQLDRWEPDLAAESLRLRIEAYGDGELLLRQELASNDMLARVKAETEARARDAGLRSARKRLAGIDPTILLTDTGLAATNGSSRPAMAQ